MNQKSEDRITRDQMFNSIARIISLRSTCPKAAVGAVLVQEGRIIAIGYNGAPAGIPHCTEVGCEIGPEGGCTRVVHAEANLISFAAKSGISTKGTTLYTTVAPCLACSKLIINAGIESIIFQEPYRNIEGLDLLKQSGVKCFIFGLGRDFRKMLREKVFYEMQKM